MAKSEDTKIWVFPSNGATKSQTFLPLKLDTWTFQNKKIWKKIWQNLGVPKWRDPPKKDARIQTLITYARLMKFSESVNTKER